MFIIQEIASVLIAGVVVVVADWKNSASAATQNQLHLANAVAEKGAWWAAMCYAGLAPKSLLKVRLRCKACHASNSASLPQLRKINCTLQSALVEKAAEKFAWWGAMCYGGLVPKVLILSPFFYGDFNRHFV